jgi:hypothetical protein
LTNRHEPTKHRQADNNPSTKARGQKAEQKATPKRKRQGQVQDVVGGLSFWQEGAGRGRRKRLHLVQHAQVPGWNNGAALMEVTLTACFPTPNPERRGGAVPAAPLSHSCQGPDGTLTTPTVLSAFSLPLCKSCCLSACVWLAQVCLLW